MNNKDKHYRKTLRKKARKLGLHLSGKESLGDLTIMVNTKMWINTRDELK